jgi:hypothetical protein
MHAIPKTLALLSVIFLPVVLINTDKLHNTDNSTLIAVNANTSTTPHRVDMHLLANAFH